MSIKRAQFKRMEHKNTKDFGGINMSIDHQQIPVDLMNEPETNSYDIPRGLHLLRIGIEETLFIPFTGKGIEVKVHYGKEEEISSYFLCNGEGCYYCKTGRTPTTKVLLPVYSPIASEIAILPMTKSSRPQDLYPQIKRILKSGKRMAVFASFRNQKHNVEAREIITPDPATEEAIKRFADSHEGDNLRLPPMYEEISNEDLAEIPDIEKLLRWKGVIK